MVFGVSVLSLLAATFYLLIVGLALGAAATASRTGRPSADRRWWLLGAVLFVVLAMLRLTGLEDHFRTLARNFLHRDGIYEMRREAQAPLSALVILGTAALVALMARMHRNTRRGSPSRMIACARLAAAVLCALIMLRVISFHAVDRLLYGPLKLNWVIDIGSCLFTGWCAWRYRRICLEGRVGGRQGSSRSALR